MGEWLHKLHCPRYDQLLTCERIVIQLKLVQFGEAPQAVGDRARELVGVQVELPERRQRTEGIRNPASQLVIHQRELFQARQLADTVGDRPGQPVPR